MKNLHFQNHKDKLGELLSYVASNAERYGEKMTNTIEYYISSYENWTTLPITYKQDIQENLEKYISKDELDKKNVYIASTSGSTGMPLKIYKDRNEEIQMTKRLWKIRKKQWFENIMNMKMLFLYRDIESQRMNYMKIGQESFLDLSEKNLAAYMDKIIEYQPSWIMGPPTAATRLATFFKEKNMTIESLKMVELTGEVIMPHQRKIIQETFNCPVVDLYGTREFGVLSYQCSQGIMHAWHEKMLFEVINDQGEPVGYGEEGALVVTSLVNKVMPLIRYYIGDIVKLDILKNPCSCGQSNLVLIPVGGRIANLVKTKNKTFTSGVFDLLISEFAIENPSVIKEFQIKQIDLENFELAIVKGDSYKELHKELLRERLSSQLEDAFIHIFEVDVIPNLQSGKTPAFIPMRDS